MMEIIKIREHPESIPEASKWFSSKWKIPQETYEESMQEGISNPSDIPQWYLARDKEKIIGGLGVIQNDFHDHKELSPNVCAVYVEPDQRNKGIAGKLLKEVCEDMHNIGYDTLYLITMHTSFYERYGWTYYGLAQGEGDKHPSRIYIHQYKGDQLI